MIFGIEWQCWCGLIIFGVIFTIYAIADERRAKRIREFYRPRNDAYMAALPERYPYIVDWDGVDAGDMAIVKTGVCSWTVMPMHEALAQGMPVHPAMGRKRYVGDPYVSINQMKQDFKGR